MTWFYRILTLIMISLYLFECIGLIKLILIMILIIIWVLISILEKLIIKK